VTLPDDFWRIDTPENVVFDYELAGLGSRFLAAAVDTLLILALQVVVDVVLIILVGSLLTDVWENLSGWVLAALGLLSFGFLWGYYVFFEMIWNGQSLGKRWVGLRVLRSDGTAISLPESIIRNLIRVVDWLPLFYGIGMVTMFINAQARRLGDLAAGTLVVHDRPAVTLESLATRADIPWISLPKSVAGLDLPVERLTPQDVQMAEDYLRRRFELFSHFRVAQRIAQALFRRMELHADQVAGVEADDFILAVVKAAHERGR